MDKLYLLNKRKRIIEGILKEVDEAVLAENMSLDMKRQLIQIYCNNDKINVREIVAFLPDNMKLISNIFASFKSKPTSRGILFCENGFYFTGNYPKYFMRYEDIKYVEIGNISLSLYETKEKYIKLRGITYVEPTPIPNLFKQLLELNEEKIDVTRGDKLKNSAIKTGKFVINMILNSTTNYSEIEKKAKVAGRDDILEEIERRRQGEAMLKDTIKQEMANYMEKNENRYSKEEIQMAKKEAGIKEKIIDNED